MQNLPGMDSHPITTENFRFISELLQREAAIVIGSGKEYLVETRLVSVAARYRLPSVNALVDQMRFSRDGGGPMERETIDALTTNETLFFRDHHPFEALRSVIIPSLLAGRCTQALRIWSAACSSGQEPYSLAMLLSEHFPEAARQSQIVGTDLCGPVLRRARAGLYQQMEVNRGLPAQYLVKYFKQQPEGWLIDETLRRRVEFREMNLAKPWLLPQGFDLILIRNVMIYFDLPTRRKILEQARDSLNPGGFLLLGGAETTLMIAEGFTPVAAGRSTFYKRSTDV